jgi:ornithine cyclodeaminase
MNVRSKWFRTALDRGQISRESIHGEVADVVTGRIRGRERPDERILILTDGLVSQDVAIAHHVYRRALEEGLGLRLPAASD